MRFQCRIGPDAQAAHRCAHPDPGRRPGAADLSGPEPSRPARDTLAHGAVAGAAALVVLAGCSTIQPGTSTMRPRIEPVLSVSHSQESSRDFVAMGDYFESTKQLERAVEAYRKAIQLDGGNVDAYNGLGVALGQMGRTIDAEGTLRQAAALAPSKAYIRNNLGYVLLLSGKPRDAVPEFAAAVEIDPGNRIAQANLRDAVARSAISRFDPSKPSETASLATRWASSQPMADSAPVSLPPVPAAPSVADASTPPAAQGSTASWTPSSASLHAVAGPAAAVPAIGRSAGRLELSNGNGVNGLAARVGRWLATQGLPADRLTNQRRFDLRRSVILYSKGHEALAQRLARALPPGVVAEAIPRPVPGTDVRLVLGRDWMQVAACLERENGCAQPDAVVALATPR